MGWLSNIFRAKPVVGYRVILDPKGKKEDLGVFYCSADQALEQANMIVMKRLFESGSADAVIANFEAVPVRGEKK